MARQRGWDLKYGDDRWAVGYVIDGEFITQDEEDLSFSV
jgi:hypothetical protein